MPLFDMIQEALTPTVDESALEMHQNDMMEEDLAAMEALGGFGELPLVEPVEHRSLSALEAMRVMESMADVRGTNIPEYHDIIHAALEANLPTGEPEYDPTAELEEIANSLAGIDTIETDTVDQPQPNDDLENDSTINDVMTMLQDKQADDPDSQGTLNL